MLNLSNIDIISIFTKLLIIFLILPIHEFAHAWAAGKMGDDTAERLGRLSINPLAHIDIVGALCLIVTNFGWAKPVPINPLRFKKQRAGIALTALAGPASNLIVAIVVTIIYRILICTPFYSDAVAPVSVHEISNLVAPFSYSGVVYIAEGMSTAYILMMILEFFILINIGLALFNLIPIPPLDGSKILYYFTSAKFSRWVGDHQQIISLVFMIVIVSGILNGPLTFLRDIVSRVLWAATGFIPMIMGA